jgi:hypothetical protein
MSETKCRKETIPTAPPGAIYVMLLFAAEGLAAENGLLSSTGKPRLLERTSWAGILRLCLETPAGQKRLTELMIEGIRRGGWPEDYVGCVQAFSREKGFRTRSIAMLEELADTAPKRFKLPDPPRHSGAAQHHPRPETTKAKPSRPRPNPSRRRGPNFTPR